MVLLVSIENILFQVNLTNDGPVTLEIESPPSNSKSEDSNNA